jgi:glycosyltransferase involved in cell wall biosynthesis
VISVVIPTRNPDRDRLQRTITALATQTLSPENWELVVIDNGSTPPVAAETLAPIPCKWRLEREPVLGLTAARRAGINAAEGDVIVFVDDDNVLDSGYLAAAATRFHTSPSLGVAGGPVIPEWETPPPDWTREFHGLLALRDLGPEERIVNGGHNARWPHFAPVGAGLVIRRNYARRYAEAVAADPCRQLLDRQGESLFSGGDNDLVFTAFHAGGDVAYYPELRVTHLIPAGRLSVGYLARLNRGVMRSWVTVLSLHGQCPWPAITPVSVGLRSARAWLRTRAWTTPAAYVRWAGQRGQFEGQADRSRFHFRQDARGR